MVYCLLENKTGENKRVDMSLDYKNSAGKSDLGIIGGAEIKAIIGLGNPGSGYYRHRHSIGFRVVDALAKKLGAQWRERENMLLAEVQLGGHKVLLIKPQTFMNNSGKVISFLIKQGIEAKNILVVHDELELPFGDIKFKVGGSHKGHNGLKSIIAVCGPEFVRLRFGIGRPEDKAQVADYVLQNFSENADEIGRLIEKAVQRLEELFS